MRSNVKWKWFLFPILGIALLAAGLVQVEAGKPAPPPPPPIPPVLYGIQFWYIPQGDVSYANRMNNSGHVVGWWATSDGSVDRHGYLYDPSINGDPTVAIDLNKLPGITGIPDGWWIGSGVGINDDGIVVGYLSATDTNVRQGYILNTKAAAPVLELLPNPPSSYSMCMRVNNIGDVLVAYQRDNGPWGAQIYRWGTDKSVVDLGADITSIDTLSLNNFTQVALRVVDGTTYGAPCRWSLETGQFEPIPSTSTFFGYGNAINDSGTVCGRTTAKPPKGSSSFYPFRYTNSLEVLWDGRGLGADAINAAGDLACVNSAVAGDSYVYQDALRTFYSIDSLIDRKNNGAADLALWDAASSPSALLMNDRKTGSGDVGQLVGIVVFSDGTKKRFLLTPVAPSP